MDRRSDDYRGSSGVHGERYRSSYSQGMSRSDEDRDLGGWGRPSRDSHSRFDDGWGDPTRDSGSDSWNAPRRKSASTTRPANGWEASKPREGENWGPPSKDPDADGWGTPPRHADGGGWGPPREDDSSRRDSRSSNADAGGWNERDGYKRWEDTNAQSGWDDSASGGQSNPKSGKGWGSKGDGESMSDDIWANCTQEGWVEGDRAGAQSSSYNTTGSAGFTKDRDVDVSDSIYIKNLPYSCSEEELSEHFGQIGRIKIDSRTNRPKIYIMKDRGSATIAFEDPDVCRTVIDQFNNSTFLGQTIRVEPSKRFSRSGGPADRGGRGGRGGRGRGGPSSGYGSRDSINSGGANGYSSYGSRDGDWTCDSCNASNFAKRYTCFRCNAPRESGPANDRGYGPPSQRGSGGYSRGRYPPASGRGSYRDDRGYSGSSGSYRQPYESHSYGGGYGSYGGGGGYDQGGYGRPPAARRDDRRNQRYQPY